PARGPGHRRGRLPLRRRPRRAGQRRLVHDPRPAAPGAQRALRGGLPRVLPLRLPRLPALPLLPPLAELARVVRPRLGGADRHRSSVGARRPLPLPVRHPHLPPPLRRARLLRARPGALPAPRPPAQPAPPPASPPPPDRG